MTLTRAEICTAIGAVIVFFLQIIVAPNIAIGYVYPNLALVYVVLVGIARPRESWPFLPFFLGLALDLMPGAYVGLNALLFTLAWFASSRAFGILNNDTIFMPIAILVITLFGFECIYGLLVSSFASNESTIAVLLQRSFPCALYDFFIGILLFIPLSKLLRENEVTQQSQVSRIR